MFSLQSIFTTARPPLSSCFTIGPSRDSFSIRSLTSCRKTRATGGGQCGEKLSWRIDTQAERSLPPESSVGGAAGLLPPSPQ